MISVSNKIRNVRENDIYLVSDFEEHDIRKFAIYDAVVLSLNNIGEAIKMLREIRSSFIESVYMLPVFLLKAGNEDYIDDPSFVLSDGIINVVHEESINSVVERIRKKRKEFSTIGLFDPEHRLLTKVLRYSYSRNINIEPVVNVYSLMGYEYPMLTGHFEKNNTIKILKLLDWGVNSKYFDAQFVDRIHLCPDCHSAHLNFREVCPKCKSPDIESDNVLHHFVCAYVGPENDFVKDERMICPKCNRRLKHIGVDYDRPSVIYNCNVCRNEFQEPVMEVLCFSCKKNSSVSDLVELDVNKYSFTDRGKEAARIGVGVNKEGKEFSVPGVINFSTFLIFLRFEIERVKSTGRVGVLGSCKLNLPSDFRSKRESFLELLTDVAMFIRDNISSGDIMTYLSDTSFFILFPEKKGVEIEVLMDTMKNSISKLVDSTVSDKNSWSVDVKFDELSERTDFDTQVKKIKAN